MFLFNKVYVSVLSSNCLGHVKVVSMVVNFGNWSQVRLKESVLLGVRPALRRILIFSTRDAFHSFFCYNWDIADLL